MTDAEKKAIAIYGLICESGEGRPLSGNSVNELLEAMARWRQGNSAFEALRRAEPQVKLAFLSNSIEWLRADARPDGNLRACQAVSEGIQIALTEVPQPLPEDLVCCLLNDYRRSLASMAQLYFPFQQLLSLLRRDQVTEGIREELRRLLLYFAPSPTGKIDERTQEIRNLMAELIGVDGESFLHHGQGPWSQLVFAEIRATEEITRLGWEELLNHCGCLEQTVPGTKWSKRSRELMHALGVSQVTSTLIRWLELGPTPGQPPEARSPIEDSAYQKGAVWCLALTMENKAAVAIGDFGIACLRKIPLLGAVSQKVGFACVQALGRMEASEAVSQLTRLRARVKYSVAKRLIEKSLQQAAVRCGLTVEDLEDVSVSPYGLSSKGVAEVVVGDVKAVIQLESQARVSAIWHNADGKMVKGAPAYIRKAFPTEVRSIASRTKELEQALVAQRVRLESSFTSARAMPLAHWHKYYLDHPLLGFLGRRLIWTFSNDQGWEESGCWIEKGVSNSWGTQIDLDRAQKVTIWHPLSSEPAEVQRWRECIFTAGIRQPFRQAFREFYQVTDDELQTRMYSNRFAGILMRQHQLASLCRTRGWDYRLMGASFDGANVPLKKLPAWSMHVELYVDLPSDRNHALRQSALGEQSGSGINLFVGSDQVRFYRDRKEIPIADVPAIVYSEVMRDVDLFTSVCAVGRDETWADQGERGVGIFSDKFDVQEFSALTELREDVLKRLLPYSSIADRCRVKKTHLEVRGQLGTYHVSIGWSGAALVTDSGLRWLRIPQKTLDAVVLDLPDTAIDLDYRTEMALRRAYVLANDWNIDSPELVQQLMPK